MINILNVFDQAGAAIERADDRLNQRSPQQQFLWRSIVIGLFIFALCLMSACSDSTAPVTGAAALANKTCVLSTIPDTAKLWPNSVMASSSAPRSLGLDSIWYVMPEVSYSGDATIGSCDKPFYTGNGQHYWRVTVFASPSRASSVDIFDSYNFDILARNGAGDTVPLRSVIDVDPVTQVIFSARADTLRDGEDWRYGQNFAKTVTGLSAQGQVHATLGIEKGTDIATQIAFTIVRVLRYKGDGSFSANVSGIENGFSAFVADKYSSTPLRVTTVPSPKVRYTFQAYDNLSLAMAAVSAQHLNLVAPIGR